MALGPDLSGLGIALNAQEAVGVEPDAAIPEDRQLMDCVPDDHPLGGESGVEPIQSGLALFEVVQIHPTAVHAVGAANDVRGAPVGVLDAGVIENSGR